MLVPKDNSAFSQQIKEVIDKCDNNNPDLFATPFTNLKFKPDFSEKLEKTYKGHALLIKDPKQVEKLTEIRTEKSPCEPYQITFKVVNQIKKGFILGEDGKTLTYEESFRQNGSYEHHLEIEPLDLGIEGLPPITRLIFSFASSINPLGHGVRELTKCELYKSPILENSVGKFFIMGVKEFIIDGKNNALTFFSNENYEFDSLAEKKNQNNPKVPSETPPKNNNPDRPSPNHETTKEPRTLKVVLIASGIVAGLSFLAFIFIIIITKKKKKIK